jgi:hypothetical protein
MRHLDVRSSNQPLVLAEEIEENASSRSTPQNGAIFVVEIGFGGAKDMSCTQTAEYFKCVLAGDKNEMVHE